MEGGTTFHFIDASPAEKDYEVEAASSPSGVTHLMFTRTGL
jgi:hypothetical protein